MKLFFLLYYPVVTAIFSILQIVDFVHLGQSHSAGLSVLLILMLILQFAACFFYSRYETQNEYLTLLFISMTVLPSAVSLFMMEASFLNLFLPIVLVYSGLRASEKEQLNYFRTKKKLLLIGLGLIVLLLRYMMSAFHPTPSNFVSNIIYFLVGSIFFFCIFWKSYNETEDLREDIGKVTDVSFKDGLTGLYNRKAMDRSLKKTMQNIGTFSLIMMDIDNFKKVNDTYGHPFGDEVLKILAEILIKNQRTADTSFRYGGEEFCVICTNTAKEDAYHLAERIRTDFSSYKFSSGGEEIHFSISLGISDCEYMQYQEPGTVISHSDIALYQAKEKGKDRTEISKE